VARSKGRNLVYILLFAVVITFLFLIGSRIFEVKDITVTGNQKLNSKIIIKLSGIIAGQNIFKLNTKNIKNNLESNPYVRVISIQRRLPSQVNIIILERKSAAVIEYLGSYIVMDQEGFILEVNKQLLQPSSPIISGMKMIAFHVGQKVQSSDPYQVKILDDLLIPIYECDIAGMLSEINIDEPNNIYFITREGLQVMMGQANELSYKISLLKSMIPELRRQGKTSGILDISAINCPVYKPLPDIKINSGVNKKK